MKTTTEVMEITGLTKSIIHNWIKLHIIEPAKPGFGKTGKHGWSSENIHCLKILAKLREQFDDPELLKWARIRLQKTKPLDEVLVIVGGGCVTTRWEIAAELVWSGDDVVTLIKLDQP